MAFGLGDNDRHKMHGRHKRKICRSIGEINKGVVNETVALVVAGKLTGYILTFARWLLVMTKIDFLPNNFYQVDF